MTIIRLGRYLWDFRTGAWGIRWVKSFPEGTAVAAPTPSLPFLRVEVE